MKSRIILLMMIVLSAMLQFACLGLVGPTDPNKPEVREYRDVVIAIYTRDPAKIVNPNSVFIDVLYELVDPDTAYPLNKDDHRVFNGIRYGVVPLSKIAENIYSATLKHVLIDKNGAFSRHAIYVRDYKIGLDEISILTPYGIAVEGEYDTTVLYSKYWFRIR